jgi:hypothetical protein
MEGKVHLKMLTSRASSYGINRPHLEEELKKKKSFQLPAFLDFYTTIPILAESNQAFYLFQ